MKPQIIFRLVWALPIFVAIACPRTLLAQIEDASTTLSEIRIVAPNDGTVFKTRADILVKVEGIDVPNVGHVIRLYEGQTLLRALVLDPLIPIRTTPVDFSFSFDWTDVRAGRYVLTATIDDISSTPVTVIVKKAKKMRGHG